MLAFGRFRAVKGLSHRSPLEPHNQGRLIQIQTSVMRTLRSLRIRGTSPSPWRSPGALQASEGGEGMGVVAIKELLEAGVHFGHQTNRWNPKMKRFLFGERNGIYIIDLQQTVARMEQAYAFARDTVAAGESVLVRRHQAPSRGDPGRRSQARQHVLRQPAMARRHVDQFSDHPKQHRQNEKDGGHPGRSDSTRAIRKKRSGRCRRRSSSSRRI